MADQLTVVCAHKNCSALFVYFFEKAHDFEGKLRVKVSGGLVSQNDLGLVDHSPGYGYSLLFAVGELGRIVPHLVMKVDHP